MEIIHKLPTYLSNTSTVNSRQLQYQSNEFKYNFHLEGTEQLFNPIGSKYGILTYIQLIFMVDVGKYTIHGPHRNVSFLDPPSHPPILPIPAKPFLPLSRGPTRRNNRDFGVSGAIGVSSVFIQLDTQSWSCKAWSFSSPLKDRVGPESFQMAYKWGWS